MNLPKAFCCPSEFLKYTWSRALNDIVQSVDVPVILLHVSTAQGFAWGLCAADIIDDAVYSAMGAAILKAEQAAYRRLSAGGYAAGLTVRVQRIKLIIELT